MERRFESPSRGRGRRGARNLDELAGTDVVEVAVDRNGFGNKRVILDSRHIVEERLLLILDGQPVDEFALARAGTFADIAETVRSELGGFKAGAQQTTHDVVAEDDVGGHAVLGGELRAEAT